MSKQKKMIASQLRKIGPAEESYLKVNSKFRYFTNIFNISEKRKKNPNDTRISNLKFAFCLYSIGRWGMWGWELT